MAFVANGGGLIRTEWSVYEGPLQDVDSMMPVKYDDAYDYGDTWTVLDAGHPLAAGLPASWDDDAGYSDVVADPAATVVIEGTGGNPLLTYRTDFGGTVVHINHDMTYTGDISDNTMQVIVNSVAFAARADVIPEPTTIVIWSLLGISWAGVSGRRWRDGPPILVGRDRDRPPVGHRTRKDALGS